MDVSGRLLSQQLVSAAFYDLASTVDTHLAWAAAHVPALLGLQRGEVLDTSCCSSFFSALQLVVFEAYRCL